MAEKPQHQTTLLITQTCTSLKPSQKSRYCTGKEDGAKLNQLTGWPLGLFDSIPVCIDDVTCDDSTVRKP